MGEIFFPLWRISLIKEMLVITSCTYSAGDTSLTSGETILSLPFLQGTRVLCTERGTSTHIWVILEALLEVSSAVKESKEEASSCEVREDWSQREQWGSPNWETWRGVWDGGWGGVTRGRKGNTGGVTSSRSGRLEGLGGHYPFVLLILEGPIPWLVQRNI